MKTALQRFWDWYERHIIVHTVITAVLFTWQLAHLYWLTTDVVFQRLFGESYFFDISTIKFLIIIADYGEIPALFTATLFYLNQMRKRVTWKAVGFIVLVNSQWLHLLWITDEFVVKIFTDTTLIGIPYALAWVAIGIDYLELPVIYDTLQEVRQYFRKKNTH